MNMTNINCQLLTIEAAVTERKSTFIHAAMLEPPHGMPSFRLTDIIKMCDELYEAHEKAGYPIL